MPGLLPIIIPPAVGAVIGYVTNVIAITMLFRPYYEKRIFNLRVPFSPGIIPKQRFELSGRIGSMVSEELFTEDAVRKQIGAASFTGNIGSSIRSYTDTVLKSPINKIPLILTGMKEKGLIIPGEATSGKGIEPIASLLPEFFNAFFRSQSFEALSERLVEYASDYIGELTLDQLLGAGKDKILQGIVDIARSPTVSDQLQKSVLHWIEEASEGDLELSYFISAENIDRLCSLAESFYPKIFPHVIAWLSQPDIHKELEKRGRGFLRDILEKLNTLQRFFVVAGQYDRALESNMDSIIDDLIKRLNDAGNDPDILKSMIGTIRSRLLQLSHFTMGDLVRTWGGTLLEDLHTVAKGVISLFESILDRERLYAWGEAVLLKYGDQKIKDLLYFRFKVTMEGLKSAGKTLLLGSRDISSRTGRLFPELYNALTDNGTQSMWKLFQMDEHLKERIDDSLSAGLLQFIDYKVPEILDSLDIRTLVVNKIDSLDIIKVEELILLVVKKQLRWINFFGALLGALIGSIQVVLNVFLN